MQILDSNYLLGLLSEAYPGVICYVGLDYKFKFASSQYSQWFGTEPAGMVGKHVQEILGKDHFDHRKPYMDIALMGSKVKFNMTFNHITLGARNTEQIYHPDVAADGTVNGFLAIVYDVTDQKRAEKSAKENEILLRKFSNRERKRLYSMFMQAPIGISVLSGPDHLVELINNQAKVLIGDRDVTGQPIEKVLPELYSENFKQMLDGIYLTGEGKSLPENKISVKLADGATKIKYLDLFFQPWKDEDGKIIGILNIALDVTEKVRANKAVEEKEELFRTYAESMPQMAFIANSKGDMTYFNQRWFDYTKLNFKDSKDWAKRPIHADDFGKAYTLWQESVASGKPYQIEYRIRRNDGTYRWHLARAVPIRNSRGRITQWVGTKTDIHDQKQAAVQLQDALKARDEFLSVASHELKTPLTSLKLQSQLTLKTLERGIVKAYLPEKQKLMAHQTNELVSRLSRLIDDMLDVSRIRTGKMPIEKEAHELTNIVEDVVARMSLLFETSNIEIPVIKYMNENIVGNWDRFRLEQVVGNLLTNAIKYGKGKPIEVEILQNEGTAQIKVKDQGHGICPNDQKRIFGRFERAIDKNEASGLGLGLYISREIVSSHEGKIWVESELGKGSTFIVELPVMQQFASAISS